MGKENFSKIKLLRIWEILKQESDEEHPLSTNQIIERLARGGISCDRRTLYQDIAALNHFGYEVISKRGQHSNSYYVVDRSFDVPELRILIDAVQAASFITEKKTAELVDKIAALGGSNRAEILKRNIVEFNTTKHSNESVYYSINAIEDGILSRNKISFLYFDLDRNGERQLRKNGERYVVNPVSMVFTNDNYYLVCYHDKHKNTASYRIDRMLDVRVTEEPINESARPKSLNISEHRKQAFSMFGGETATVRFEADVSLLDVIYDKFGEKTVITSRGDNMIEFTATVQLSPVFFGWCCTFGDKLKIVSPKTVVTEMKKHLQKISSNYDIVSENDKYLGDKSIIRIKDKAND